MSGGYFDYYQYHIDEIIDKINDYVYGKEIYNDANLNDIINNSWLDDEEKEYLRKNNKTLPNKYKFSDNTIQKFKDAIKYLKIAQIYAQRIDWLLSGDDDENDFHNRLNEDLNNEKL